MTQLKDLVGHHKFPYAPMSARHPFDPQADGIVFRLGDTNYMIFEDPDNGYRSAAGPILTFDGELYDFGGAYPNWLHDIHVNVTHETEGSGWSGQDDVLVFRNAANGKEVFRIGTENVNDYYPSFICRWDPEGLSND